MMRKREKKTTSMENCSSIHKRMEPMSKKKTKNTLKIRVGNTTYTLDEINK